MAETGAMIQIITLEPERWPEYRELRLEALRTCPQAFCSTYGSQIDKPAEWWQDRLISARSGESWLLFAEENARLVGMIGAVWDGDALDIISMYVQPASQGKGIGRRLMSAILDATMDKGATKHVLSVNSVQNDALRLYQSFDFQITHEVQYTFGDGQTYLAYDMERKV